jgi:hypothetical protein
VLKELAHHLTPKRTKNSSESSSFQAVNLCGLGGIGKSVVAREFALKQKANFDAIFWVRCSDRSSAGYNFCQIALELGLDEGPEDTVVLKSLVWEWLANPYKNVEDVDLSQMDSAPAKWLLILDGADDFNCLEDLLPLSGSGSVLVTSRDPLAGRFLPGCQPIYLGLLDSEGAAQMLLDSIKYHVEEKECSQSRQLVDKLGRLPMTIASATDIMLRRELTVNELLEVMQHDLSILSTVNPPLEVIWRLDELSPAAVKLLEVISFLHNEEIAEKLLLAKDDAGDCLLGFVGGIQTNPLNAYFDARSELIRRSLVERDRNSRALHMLQIVQDIVRNRMTPHRHVELFQTVVKLLLAAMPLPEPDSIPVDQAPLNIRTLEPHVTRLEFFYDGIRDIQTNETLRGAYGSVRERFLK